MRKRGRIDETRSRKRGRIDENRSRITEKHLFFVVVKTMKVSTCRFCRHSHLSFLRSQCASLSCPPGSPSCPDYTTVNQSTFVHNYIYSWLYQLATDNTCVYLQLFKQIHGLLKKQKSLITREQLNNNNKGCLPVLTAD